MAGDDGARYGFQLTFLRIGIVPPGTPLSPSKWAARDAYWAQFAFSDARAGRRHRFERLARGAPDISGATATRVWVENWNTEIVQASDAKTVLRLRAAQAEVGIDLQLAPDKREVTRTGGEPFHAYLVTRLDAAGTVRADARAHSVRGQAWLDRAWGEVPLPLGAVVWDRFLLQLEDGRDVMVVRLHRRDAGSGPALGGFLVAQDGGAVALEGSEILLEERNGRWRLELPAHRLALDLEPYVPHHGEDRPALDWHAVRIGGDARGHGYVELSR